MTRKGTLFLPLLMASSGSVSAQTLSATLPEPFPLKARVEWATKSSVSPQRFAGYTFSSAIMTATNNPREYGPHWDGFGKRIGLRMSTGATGLFMEGTLGALWDEDPRYIRAAGQPLKSRLWNIAKMSVLAHNTEGKIIPAYARYISVPANSYLSNTWRPDSQATFERGTARIPLAFVDRMIANAFSEFWPDIKRRFQLNR